MLIPDYIAADISTGQAGALLGRTGESVRASCACGTIPARKNPAGEWRVSMPDLDEAIGPRNPDAGPFAASLLEQLRDSDGNPLNPEDGPGLLLAHIAAGVTSTQDRLTADVWGTAAAECSTELTPASPPFESEYAQSRFNYLFARGLFASDPTAIVVASAVLDAWDDGSDRLGPQMLALHLQDA